MGAQLDSPLPEAPYEEGGDSPALQSRSQRKQGRRRRTAPSQETRTGITPLPQGPFLLCLHPQPQAWVPAREPRRPSVFNLLRVGQIGRNSEERGTEVPLSLAMTFLPQHRAQRSAGGTRSCLPQSSRAKQTAWDTRQHAPGKRSLVPTREAFPLPSGSRRGLWVWGRGRWESLPLCTARSLVRIICLVLPCTFSTDPFGSSSSPGEGCIWSSLPPLIT